MGAKTCQATTLRRTIQGPFTIVSKIGTTDCLPIPAYEIGVKDAVRYRRYIFLVILVDRVRSTWGHPDDAQMHKTNLNVAAFP